MTALLSIGEAAKQAGVSVQTLRHYDKLGLLIPSQQTAAGYRRYSQPDCERLQLIRALRELGFALETIAELLDRKIDASEAIALRLAALEVEQRALKRRQLILAASMNGERNEVLARLQRKHVLAKLDRLEREHFLAKHLNWKPDDSPASQAVWRAAVFELPEQMDEAQLEAWIELAEIAADERFRATLERHQQLTRGMSPAVLADLGKTLQEVFTGAVQAAREKRSARDEASQAQVTGWIRQLAQHYSRAPDAEFVRWLISHLAGDPRIDRYWELMSKLKGAAFRSAYAVHGDATDWLGTALRARLQKMRRGKLRRSGRVAR
jgi:DNA-binding transcriptional MerR regulator